MATRKERRGGTSLSLLAVLVIVCFAVGVLWGRQLSLSLAQGSEAVALRGSGPTPSRSNASAALLPNAALRREREVATEPPQSLPTQSPVLEALSESDVDSFLISSLHVDGDAFLELPSGLDREGLLVSLFVRLDCAQVSTMRTVLSNKAPGCDASADHFGFALFVNDWQQSDQRLHLEYGSRRSGCEKLSSETRVECGKWHYLALHCSATRVALYLDAVEVGVRSWDASSRRESQQRTALRFGRFPHSSDVYPLFGNVSRVSISYVSEEAEVPAYLKRLMNLNSPLPLAEGVPRHHFPLVTSDVAVKDSISGLEGKFKVSLAGDDLVAAFRCSTRCCLVVDMCNALIQR